MTNPAPFPKKLSLFGVSLTLLATAEQTFGGWSLIEYAAPPSFAGPAAHYHKVTTEAFYILEGRLRFRLGEETIEAGPGEYVHVRPGIVHQWSNPEARPAKFLVIASPSGIERYFEQLDKMIGKATSWPPSDMRPVVALAEKFDTYTPDPS